jgi:Flp pilus assembly protein TadD
MDDKGDYYTENAAFLAKQDELRDLMTTQALKQAPDFAPVHAERSFLLYLDHQYPQALSHINQAIRLAPANYEYYAKRGDIYRDMNQSASARKDYLKAIAMLEDVQTTRKLNPLEEIDLKFIKEMRAILD